MRKCPTPRDRTRMKATLGVTRVTRVISRKESGVVINERTPNIGFISFNDRKPDKGELLLIESIFEYLYKRSNSPLYDATKLIGIRTRQINMLQKNIYFWLQDMFSDGATKNSLSLLRDCVDKYGNVERRYILEFKDFIGPSKYTFNGVLVIDSNARLENRPVFKGPLGAFSNKFVKVRKMCKYITQPVFVIQMKFWIDEDNFYLLELAELPVDTDCTAEPIHLRKDHEDHESGEKRRYYQFTGPLRTSGVGR